MSGVQMMVMNNVQPISTFPAPTLYLDALDYSGSGTTWTAETGSDATLVNTPTYTAPSPTYFDFDDASGEYATVPDLGDLNRWTVEAWFRLDSVLGAGDVTAVVCNQFDLVNKLNFSIGTNLQPTNANICVGFFDGAWRTTAGFSAAADTWYHVVGTYDGATVKQYVDAVLDTQLSYSGTPQSGGEVRIAARWDSLSAPNDFFPGDIGLVRIWNSALTADQVQELYDENVDRFSLTPTVTSFTTVETTSWTAPAGVSRVQYLVVGGGGGGGTGYDSGGGGGGAGGMVLTDYLDVVPGTEYTVTVGAGGTGGPDTRTNTSGNPGGNSVFATVTALGGGAGQGSRTFTPTARYTGGAAQVGSSTAALGGGGGGGGDAGGGGGGAGGAGGTRVSASSAGIGGAGVASSITGSSVTYGAGGAGGTANVNNNNGATGANNTGAGGGAGSALSANSGGGGDGGSGIVVVKYGT